MEGGKSKSESTMGGGSWNSIDSLNGLEPYQTRVM
jgi:hypothetical protein